MEDSKAHIKELISRFNKNEAKTSIDIINHRHKEKMRTRAVEIDNIKQNIHMLSRKNSQIEAEISRQQLQQGKNNELFNKKNNERLRLAKKLIDLEQINEDLENSISTIEAEIAGKENEINKLSYPSTDALYYEIIRGFNVDFYDNRNSINYEANKEASIIGRIRNREKNDIFTVEINENDDISKVCNRIWELM